MTPFVPNEHLTAIALGFKNAQFIADLVAPRVEVFEETFKWTEYNTQDTFTIPNTMVGRKSRTNEVEFGATEHDDSVVDYGLSDVIPQADIKKAESHPAFDPKGRATMKLSELVSLGREKRVADFVMTAANYNHSEAVTSGDKWTDAGADVISQLGDALNTPLVRPNTMILGHEEAWALRKNKQLVKAIKGSEHGEGLVSLAAIAEMFELERILVGASRHNVKNPGQPMELQRLWQGGAALHYIKSAAQLKDDVTFMLTAGYQGKVAHEKMLEPGEVGIRGGVRVTVGDSVKEVPISKEAGYFLQGVI